MDRLQDRQGNRWKWKEKNIFPKLAESEEDVGGVGHSQMINLYQLYLEFRFWRGKGIRLKVNYKQGTNHAADVHITNKLSS